MFDFSKLYDTEMKIRGRGNSTWYFHLKKAFQLKFGDKTEMLGMPKDKKWIFLAEHSDKTLMRNKIAFEMGYINKAQLLKLAKPLEKNQYGQYLNRRASEGQIYHEIYKD